MSEEQNLVHKNFLGALGELSKFSTGCLKKYGRAPTVMALITLAVSGADAYGMPFEQFVEVSKTILNKVKEGNKSGK